MRARAGPPLLVGLVALSSPALGQAAFKEVARDLGLVFRHHPFGTGEKYMPENMGAGLAVFDADGDGLLDVYLVQGAPLADAPADPEAVNRLFHQRPDGRFEDVTAAFGVGDRGYGMGTAVGDIDRDGDLDLFVTNFGRDTLYENLGGGTFRDVTERAGITETGWSASAGFFDADGDGDLDLFVTRYLDFSLAQNKYCGNAQIGLRSYCHPDVYDGAADLLYRNDGSGRFTEVGRQRGLRASHDDKGLGLVLLDLDGDGYQDVYVANDSTMNYLYLGRPDGRFVESALLAGVGFNGSGETEASMGVEVGDLDGDGRVDLFLTHLDEETDTLYRGLGDGLWRDATAEAGLAAPTRPWVGFGTVLLDYDHDGDEDLFVANGHIIDNIAAFDSTRRHRQPAQLFENLGGGRFRERSELLGLSEPLVGRGAVGADLDGDGDVDLLVTQNDGPLIVLRNDSPIAARSLAVRLRSASSTPAGQGARVELQASDGRRQIRWASGARSYLSQGPGDLHFGLPAGSRSSTLLVLWPDGSQSRYPDLAAGATYEVVEGEHSARAIPYRR